MSTTQYNLFSTGKWLLPALSTSPHILKISAILRLRGCCFQSILERVIPEGNPLGLEMGCHDIVLSHSIHDFIRQWLVQSDTFPYNYFTALLNAILFTLKEHTP